MQNRGLAKDYITRCEKRLLAIKTLFDNESWADVVRESQEVVELASKALLRANNIEPPRTHDVSSVLKKENRAFPEEIQQMLPKIAKISHSLRRDRELAYYGSEDLTPSEFYQKEDAQEAFRGAEWVVKTIAPFIF